MDRREPRTIHCTGRGAGGGPSETRRAARKAAHTYGGIAPVRSQGFRGQGRDGVPGDLAPVLRLLTCAAFVMAGKNILTQSEKKNAMELVQSGRFPEAKKLLEEVCGIDRADAEAWFMLGIVCGRLDDTVGAIASLRQAIILNPDNALAHYNLGMALHARKQPDEAIQAFQEAVRLAPLQLQARIALSDALFSAGRLDEAAACYQKVLAIRPDYADALNNLGNIYKEQGTLDEAVACYQKALTIRPDDAMTNHNLGNTLKDLGKLDGAIACYQKALTIKPDFAEAHSNQLLVAHYASLYTPAELFAEHLKFAEQFEAPLKPSWRPHTNTRDPEKRLKVGYVSPDLRHHAVAYFIEPVLAHHDKSRVEVFCYYNHTRQDSFTDRLRAAADHWATCQDMPDERLAERIRADGIDILVDLAGHTGENRLLVFARKPAPVQVTYLGYINTTGLSAIDYRLTDALSDPPGQEAFYIEKLGRLPGGFLCYQPLAESPPVAPPPALTAGHITFGSFNNLAKINPGAGAVWVNLIERGPGARLFIKNLSFTDLTTRERYYGLFEKNGAPRERVELMGQTPTHVEHLALYSRLDIALDTFPYNGTTTTCEAMWMGVPVITLAGSTHAGRVGVSLLNNSGFKEWI